ncbi:Histidinol-phosphatase [Alkalibacterium sp. AK22]|uniref:histidinol-phosphatase HisJ n=1 Tax=Alkalibacterium sp. AK22 TaxID=1229520 RepID=UPI00044E772B|nr:histidinol-phosphatase HisJ [Alkalibacterium sp. AK22]EXJ22931.1 Histidinol-phosphatase [Alkalibacterium sp. AK22]
MFSDNHVHTQYCPHGSPEVMEMYVQAAVKKGLTRLTFTEHAPLMIDDTVPEKDSAMSLEDLSAYIKEGEKLKKRYQHDIDIRIGLEVDYIEGKEKETEAFLRKYSSLVPYSILSVHFILLPDGTYFCIDYSKESFMEKIDQVGFDTLTQTYERTLHKALSLPFGDVTPKTLGHLNLIQKFDKAHGRKVLLDWTALLDKVSENHYRLDYNFAGLDKPLYGQTYPSAQLVSQALDQGIELSHGSDAHHPDEIGRYFERSVENG